jgi:hypothetical protein
VIRRDRSHLSVSLFPFLSVLACVTGTLSFMISGMTAVQLGDTEQLIELTESGAKKAPRYVECRSEGLLIHPQGKLVTHEKLSKSPNPYLAVLTQIAANSESQCLILLVRPDGVASYERAWKIAQEFGKSRKRPFDMGSDAIYAAGPLRFETAPASENPSDAGDATEDAPK